MLDEQRERLLSTSHSGQRKVASYGHADIRRLKTLDHAPAHQLAMRTQLFTLAFAAPVRLEQMNGRVARGLSGFGHDLAPFVFE